MIKNTKQIEFMVMSAKDDFEDSPNENNKAKYELQKKEGTRLLKEILRELKGKYESSESLLEMINPESVNHKIFTENYYEKLESEITDIIDVSDYQIEEDFDYPEFLDIAEKVFEKVEEFTKHSLLDIKKDIIEYTIRMLYSDSDGPSSIGSEIMKLVQEFLENKYAI